MISAAERAAVVTLLRLGRRPLARYAELLEAAPSAESLFHEELEQSGGQGLLLPPDPEPLLAEARADLDMWTGQGYTMLTVLDDEYPHNLREVHDRPPLIFVAGRYEPRDVRSLAIIGSRQASPAGLATARRLAAAFVAADYTVVSGLAAGIDTAAHTATLEAGGRTLAVIGTGVARVYPAENADLQQRIADEAAVISQFWPDAEPSRRTFPLRNAVMSGMARGTVVVEASERSGARIQTRLALAHGRPVFLLPALLGEPWGRDLAARPGVHVVGAADEILATVERLRATDVLVD